jgi:hypothetical protein
MAVTPVVALAQPGVSPQAQAAALEKIIQGEDARNGDLIREAMQGGAQRRAGIRALGRLEQPDQIRYVAPAWGTASESAPRPRGRSHSWPAPLKPWPRCRPC